jgi:hypothetical protein
MIRNTDQMFILISQTINFENGTYLLTFRIYRVCASTIQTISHRKTRACSLRQMPQLSPWFEWIGSDSSSVFVIIENIARKWKFMIRNNYAVLKASILLSSLT